MSDTRLGFTNNKVQRLRRLLASKSERDADGAFVVEGEQLLGEALRAQWPIQEVFVDPSYLHGLDLSKVHLFELQEGVLDRVASTETPQGIIAVVGRRRSPGSVGHGWVLVLDRLADPGNVGTLIRSAEAFGAGAVCCTRGTADPFSPKAVRASAGALFHLPVVVDADLEALRASGFSILGTTSHPGAHVQDIEQVGVDGDVAIVLGNEAHGMDPQSVVDGWVSIGHVGRSESLNVAMAGTVLCYVVASRRSPGDGRTSVS